MAEETGVRIALENLPGKANSPRPLESMQEHLNFITDYSREYVGLCLDTGHAQVSGFNPANQARIASDRLWALHIQDVDGKSDCHWLPGRGVIDWTSLGIALEDIGFDGAWTIEVFATHTPAMVEEIASECSALRILWETDGMSSPVD